MFQREFTTRTITAEPISAESFAEFGTLLCALDDGTPFTAEEAQLDVSRGTPRYYLMRLEHRPPRFAGITRHRQTTQALLSVGGKEWLLAVAPPKDLDIPDATPCAEEIRAFRVPGDVVVLMKRGTWHSGPHFTEDEMSFANLELADTNVVDHQTYRLDRELGFTMEIV
jgi:ureidoglycolate lyase